MTEPPNDSRHPDYNAWVTLSNDVTGALGLLHNKPLFSQRLAVATDLWKRGYRPTASMTQAEIERQQGWVHTTWKPEVGVPLTPEQVKSFATPTHLPLRQPTLTELADDITRERAATPEGRASAYREAAENIGTYLEGR